MDNYLDKPLASFIGWDGIPTSPGLKKILAEPFGSPGEWVPVLPHHLIGIEIEVERGIPNEVGAVIPKSWIKQVEDGSLRNAGIEFVTCAHEMRYTEALLYHLFKNLPARADFSLRTSTHVHVNVRDMTIGQVLTVLYVYLVVEKLLYNYVGHDRDKGIFCVPLQETFMTTSFLQELRTNLQHFSWMKYTGLNLLPIQNRGTIEFRHMIGTAKYQEVLQWVNIIAGMFKFALSLPPEVAHERILALNTTSDYTAFLYDVFPEHHRQLTQESSYVQSMEKGVSFIKSMAYDNDFKNHLTSIAKQTSPLYEFLYKDAPKPKKLQTKPFGIHIPPPPPPHTWVDVPVGEAQLNATLQAFHAQVAIQNAHQAAQTGTMVHPDWLDELHLDEEQP